MHHGAQSGGAPSESAAISRSGSRSTRRIGRIPLADGFGALEVSMRTAWRRRRPLAPSRPDAEVITYVYRGGLACYGAVGRSGLIQAGEFQRTTPGGTGRHRENNASRTDWAHVFRLWLGPCQAVLEPALTQKRFSTADRRVLFASSPRRTGAEARCSSTRTPCCTRRCRARANTSSTSCRTDGAPGCTSSTGRALAGVVLSSGDGVGLTAERTYR